MTNQHPDFEVTQTSLRTDKAEGLLAIHLKLYGREYPGISKSELIGKIIKKLRNYTHLYEITH